MRPTKDDKCIQAAAVDGSGSCLAVVHDLSCSHWQAWRCETCEVHKTKRVLLRTATAWIIMNFYQAFHEALQVAVLASCPDCGGFGAAAGSTAPACGVCRGAGEILKNSTVNAYGRWLSSYDQRPAVQTACGAQRGVLVHLPGRVHISTPKSLLMHPSRH